MPKKNSTSAFFQYGPRLIDGSDLDNLLAGNTSFQSISIANGTAAAPALIYNSVTSNITALAGGGQTGATQLYNEVNVITTVASRGDSVLLPVSSFGLEVCIINLGANPVSVYPQVGDAINGLAANAAVTVLPNSCDFFVSPAPGSWYGEFGSGFSGSLITMLSQDNITATTGGQGGAFQLTSDFNRVTGGSAGYGVVLPPSAAGLDVLVLNHSGVNIQVYGNGNDQIDDIAASTGVNQMPSSVVLYTSYSAGKWYTNGLATGYAGNGLETVQFADNITAAAAQNGIVLTGAINNVTTVASNNGVTLPISTPGMSVTIQNGGVNPLTVWGNSSDTSVTINGVAGATGIILNPGAVGVFNCTTAAAWICSATSTKTAAVNTNASSSASTVLTAANISGATNNVDLIMTGAITTASNIQLPTVSSLINLLHNPSVGTSYRLRIINQGGSSSGVWTVTTNTGWGTVNNLGVGSANIPISGGWRDFDVTITSIGSATATIQTVGVSSGTF